MQAGSNFFGQFRPKSKVTPAPDPLSITSTGPQQAPPQVYISAGQLHEQKGAFAAAESKYRQALSADPTNLMALLHLGRLYDRQQNFQAAQMTYQKAISAHPQSAIAMNDLALCYARQGQVENARTSLEKAIALAPNNRMYRNNIATVLIEAGELGVALRHLQAVNRESVAHYNVAVLLYKQNSNAMAAQHFARAAELDPSLTQAKTMASRLQNVAPVVAGNEYRAVSTTAPVRPSDNAEVTWPGVRQPTNATNSPGRSVLAPSPAPWQPSYAGPTNDLRKFPPVE